MGGQRARGRVREDGERVGGKRASGERESGEREGEDGPGGKQDDGKKEQEGEEQESGESKGEEGQYGEQEGRDRADQRQNVCNNWADYLEQMQLLCKKQVYAAWADLEFPAREMAIDKEKESWDRWVTSGTFWGTDRECFQCYAFPAGNVTHVAEVEYGRNSRDVDIIRWYIDGLAHGWTMV